MSKPIRKKITSVHLIELLQRNIIVTIVALCIAFVGIIAFYRLYVKKETFVYVKVKVSQGYWWATTQKPNMWYIKAIQGAKEEKDVVGAPLATVLRVAYYPWYGSNSFDIFVTLRIKVTRMGKSGPYNFRRETIGVSSPIDFEFDTVQFTGTIVQMSEKPIDPVTRSKTVYLSKKYTYPWEYDAIKVGDYFNDGNANVIEILDKAKGETNEIIVNEGGKLISQETEEYRYIALKIKMRVREDGGQIFYGDEIIVSPGRNLGFVTNGFTFNDYVVSKIED